MSFRTVPLHNVRRNSSDAAIMKIGSGHAMNTRESGSLQYSAPPSGALTNEANLIGRSTVKIQAKHSAIRQSAFAIATFGK